MTREVVDTRDLVRILNRIDGRGYGAYKCLKNLVIDYGLATGFFTRIQSDPYARPSVLELTISRRQHRFPLRFFSRMDRIAFTDYVCRVLYRLLKKLCRKCGSGYSCYMGVPKPSNRVLYRSCVETHGGSLVLRFYTGLPARGRRIISRHAKRLLVDSIEKIVMEITSLSREHLDDIEKRIMLYRDQEYIREWLKRNNYVSFIADNSLLPRESSLSEKPLEDAVLFKSPDSLRVEIRLPSGKTITGMTLPSGVTIITGGGYHGKTTLVEAIQDGVYNHVEGDGREYVVSIPETMTVRAENGRIVSCVDISSFIDKLPRGSDTRCFSSLKASGSTSMAASLSEAVEAGARLLLIDEDTCATNLLFKDRVMEEIIRYEPIKPLSTIVRNLCRKAGLSLVVVTGSSSAFLSIADKVLLMENYRPLDITMATRRYVSSTIEREYRLPRERLFRGIKGVSKVKTRGYRLAVRYSSGKCYEIDLSINPRIVEEGQVRLIGYIVRRLASIEEPFSIKDLVRYVDRVLVEKGFRGFVDPVPPDLTMVSGLDVVWVLNRLYNAVFT